MLKNADLQRLLRASPGLFVLLLPDDDFTIVAASAEYLKTSHTDESIYGRPLLDVFPDTKENQSASGNRALRASLDRVKRDKTIDRMPALRYDLPQPAADGGGFEARYWLPINEPLFDVDGRIEFIVHRVDEVSAKSNQKAVEILESLTEGFFTLDRNWCFDYVNAEAHSILGVDPGSLAGRVIWNVYPGLEGTPFWTCYHETMDARVKTSFTAFYANQQRWYEVTVFPAAEGISVYFRNVTKQKTVEEQREALSQLSRRLGDVHDASRAGLEGAVVIATNLGVSRVGYGTVDHDTGHLTVVEDWCRSGVESLSGVTPLRDYGTFLDNLLRGDAIVIQDVRADARTSAAADALEARHARSFVNVPVMERDRLVAVLFVNDDKVRHWTQEEIQFIQEAAARTRTAVQRATAEEVLRASEERYRRLNDELAETSRMKDEFLATLGHELRNPLAPISNALQILRLGGSDPALVEKTRALMERQVRHVVRLIDDLLDLSRLSRGLVELKVERVSLASAIATALEASRPFIEQSGHRLAVDLPGEDLAVMADPIRITQVLTNLLNNAGKFTPKGGRLELSLERDAEYAVVRVRDNGIGIRADMLERVFNMFEQVDRSYAQVSGGLGIGLALVKRLVEAQGGRVKATSGGPGLGSEFTVRMPLAVAIPTEDSTSYRDAAAPAPSAQRILIADDNEDAAKSLAFLLELDGHEIRIVMNGAQAIEVAKEFQPDVAVLDIGMPVLDGLEAARAIRALPLGPRTSLVALSGFGLRSDDERSTAAGFDRHLVKPADMDQLNRLISTNPHRR